ncbi:LSU ribosomal protein L17P [Malonomonas rubra DSM 5091]|uniref:Large ribosomal subunit protein bL17 n=1 Tax=Malonomonas rubra DSM 5091 TaxID=1122189 RepID=A0A1M6MU41_MALRU|nr:LSU ribosomal protein L17P [Malonomonas rubra DSM 5091]
MRHNKSGRRLGRKPDHRQHMMRNMVTSFFEHEKITTTDTRAKELRKVVDKMITLGKRGDLHARRQALQVIRDRQVVGKLFEMIAPRYTERPGGYTRIIKLANRQGDNAPMAIIELVEEEFTPKTKKAAPAPVAEVAEEAPAVEEVEAAEESVAEEAVAEEAEVAEEATEEAAEEEKKED